MAEEVRKETMEDYSKELEASFKPINEGDIVSGTVISVNEEEVILDFNSFAQGVIKAEDMSNDPKFNLLEEVKIGDSIKATVVRRTMEQAALDYPVKRQRKSFHGMF